MRSVYANGLVAIDRGMPSVWPRITMKVSPGVNIMPSWPVVRQEGVEGNAMTLGDKANKKTVIRLLNEALATEILCILRYKRHYFMTAGISARRAKAKFLQHVAEEQAHADQLAARSVQLGGEPELSLERMLNRSHAEHVEGDSLAEMITADLVAERISIDSYCAMIASIGDDDPTTRQVLERILAQEEAHAENLASLVRD